LSAFLASGCEWAGERFGKALPRGCPLAAWSTFLRIERGVSRKLGLLPAQPKSDLSDFGHVIE